MPAPHTPTPWFVCRDDSDPKNDASLFIQSETAVIARMDRRGDGSGTYMKRTKADAEHIVHCVNTHEALVEALRAAEVGLGMIGQLDHFVNYGRAAEIKKQVAAALATQPQP